MYLLSYFELCFRKFFRLYSMIRDVTFQTARVPGRVRHKVMIKPHKYHRLLSQVKRHYLL